MVTSFAVDLAKDITGDGETYGCVKSFGYLGDTLDGNGGAYLAATARIRNGWMKFRELLPFLTSLAPSLEIIIIINMAYTPRI